MTQIRKDIERAEKRLAGVNTYLRQYRETATSKLRENILSNAISAYTYYYRAITACREMLDNLSVCREARDTILNSENVIAQVKNDAISMYADIVDNYVNLEEECDNAEMTLDDMVEAITSNEKLKITEDAIKSNIDKEEGGEEEQSAASKYLSDNGRIVAVTYGGKDGVEDAAFKTAILNYNSYAVSVFYNGVGYTIPAYDYVIIAR